MGNNTIKKKKATQIGNFLVTFDTGELKAVKITAVAGNWNIRYREDHFLFTWIKNCLKTEEGKEMLHLVFSCWYAATNSIPDQLFLEDIVQAYKHSIDRMKESAGKISDAEDQEIINEMKSEYESTQSTTNDTN